MEQEKPEVSCSHGQLNRAECQECAAVDQVQAMIEKGTPIVIERSSGEFEDGWKLEAVIGGRVYVTRGTGKNAVDKSPRIQKFLAWQRGEHTERQ